MAAQSNPLRVVFNALSSGVKPFDKPRLPRATATMAARLAAVPLRKTARIPHLPFLASPPPLIRTQYPSTGVKPLAPSGDSVAMAALSAAPYLRKKVLSSMPIFRTYYNPLEVIGIRDFSTYRNKNEVADYVKNCKENRKDGVADFLKNLWYNMSQENRSIIKEYFISLSVPAVFSGVLWLVSAGADIVKDTQLSRGTLDDPSTTQLPAQVVAIKEELDGKLLQLFKEFEDYVKSQSETGKLKEIIVSLEDEKDIKESQIIILRDKLLEKEAEIDILKHLLAGRMRQAGVVWFKHFAKNLNNASLLSYYDAPEHSGLIFWYPN